MHCIHLFISRMRARDRLFMQWCIISLLCLDHHSCMRSFIHFIHSLMFMRSCAHSFIHAFVRSSTHFIYLSQFIHVVRAIMSLSYCLHAFAHFVHATVISFIHSFHSWIHSLIRSLVQSFTRSNCSVVHLFMTALQVVSFSVMRSCIHACAHALHAFIAIVSCISCMQSCIHSFVHACMYLFLCAFMNFGSYHEFHVIPFIPINSMTCHVNKFHLMSCGAMSFIHAFNTCHYVAFQFVSCVSLHLIPFQVIACHAM